MARNRMIKLDFWTDDKILSCSRDARLFFIGLWNHSTDAGIGKISNFELKAKIYPVDNDIDPIKDIPKLLDELFIQGLLKISTCSNYYKIAKWESHQTIQRPNHKEIAKYEHLTFDYRRDSLSIHGTLNEDSMSAHAEVNKLSKEKENKLNKVKLKEKKHQIHTNDEFDLFYNNYPRKIEKQRAIKSFNKLNKSDTELIIKRTNDVWLPYWQSKYMRDGKWISTEFIPHPATYINQRKYEGDPPIIHDQKSIEQQELRAKEMRIVEQQKRELAYYKHAESQAPKTQEEFNDVKSLIGDTLEKLRNKHN